LKTFASHGPTEPWVAPGQPVQIQGYAITSGMFYIREPKPFAIEPWLRVEAPDYSSGFHGSGETSYGSLSPAQRGAYLNWLTHNRREPATVPLSFLQLFFAGLERRLFLDGDHNLELGLAVADLLAQFQSARYDLPFISWLHFWAHFSGPESYCVVLDWLLAAGHGIKEEHELDLALHNLALAKRPLDPQLAYELVALHPKRHPRSASVMNEAKRRFLGQFAESFPGGLALSVTEKTKGVRYTSYSPGLITEVRLAGGPSFLTWEVRDIWTANGRFSELIRLWNDVVEEEIAPKLPVSAEGLKALTRETREIQETLAQRLSRRVEEPQPAKVAEALGEGARLHAACGPIMRELIHKPQWTRTEFGILAKKHGRMPFGLIQDLNAWSLEVLRDRLIFGDDPISINQQLTTRIKNEYE
jgi:hypothetical protein